MDLKIIDSSLHKKNFETSVLLPIRQDKRVHKLLEGLSKQKYTNFVLMIANDSKEPCLKKEDFPKNLNYIYYHTPEEKYSTFDKLNFLSEKVETPICAITESDCEVSPDWLKELVPIAKKEKTVIKGCEIRPISCCTANLVFPTEILKKVKFDTGSDIFGDYEWGINVKKQGYDVKACNFSGPVFHNLTSGKPRFDRIIPSAKADMYIAFKHRELKLISKKIYRAGYNTINNFLQMIVMIIIMPYYYFKFFRKKE